MIHMQPDLNNLTTYYMKMSCFEDMKNLPTLPLFSEEICELLNQLSTAIRNDKEAKRYPDVVTFGFFCRKANLLQMKQQYYVPNRLGRGLSFHIAPSNVPINFAYSFVMGLLSGNACIVRTSSKDFPQIRIICRLLKELEEKSPIVKYLAVVGYPHDKTVTDYFSSLASTRVIWGGDYTIEQIRKSPVGVRCQDVMFSNRYSLCVINASAILELDNMERLAQGFYNDTYMYDQNACSSPRLLYWKGADDEVQAAQERFWNMVASYIDDKYELEAVVAIDKLTLGYKMAIELQDVTIKTGVDNRISRVVLKNLVDGLEDYTCPGGCFLEYVSEDLQDLVNVVTEKYQTMTYFGFKSEELAMWTIQNGLSGIDRIVPIGKATDFNILWDGYNLINTLSRVVYYE